MWIVLVLGGGVCISVSKTTVEEMMPALNQ